MFQPTLRRLGLVLTCALLATARPAWARDALAGGNEHLAVDLVAETESTEPGAKATVGVRFQHAEHWHSYWRHTETGNPAQVTWTLPEGWSVGPCQWPAPSVSLHPGDSAAYQYVGTTALLFDVSVPPEATLGAYTLKADVYWMACADQCLDGTDSLALDVQVSRAPRKDTEHKPLFDAMRSMLEEPLPEGVTAEALGAEKVITLTLEGAGPWSAPDAKSQFLASEGRHIHYAGEQSILRAGSKTTWSVPRAPKRPKKMERLRGALLVEQRSGRKTYTLDVPVVWAAAAVPPVAQPVVPGNVVTPAPGVSSPSPAPIPGTAPVGPVPAGPVPAGPVPGGPAPVGPAPVPPPGSGEDPDADPPKAVAAKGCEGWLPEPGTPLHRFAGLDLDQHGIVKDYEDSELPEGRGSLLLLLLFAFLGGAILNLMPCVLPVLSIKIMGFVSQANDEPVTARRHGYAFALGVLCSFWLLAGVLIAFRAFGKELGWGFQLQEPAFVAVMTVLMAAVGLNLAGLFEVGTSVMNMAGEASSRLHATGYASSFWSGALATAIATPCTAPFMGPAVGYAVTAPPVESLLLFTALGLGMSAPYVLLSASPRLLRKVPRPGAWMDTFKHALAWPMFAVALYLTWVFGKQTGVDGAIWLLFGVLSIAVGLWAFGRWGGPERTPRKRWVLGRGLSLAFILLGVVAFIAPATAERPPPRGASGEWTAWTSTEVACQLREGRPVFVDFTADWCLSCKTNESAFIDTETVRAAVRQHGVAMLKGDWTLKDEPIRKVLASYRRVSVPLYVVFSPYRRPYVLGSAITAGSIADAMARAATK